MSTEIKTIDTESNSGLVHKLLLKLTENVETQSILQKTGITRQVESQLSSLMDAQDKMHRENLAAILRVVIGKAQRAQAVLDELAQNLPVSRNRTAAEIYTSSWDCTHHLPYDGPLQKAVELGQLFRPSLLNMFIPPMLMGSGSKFAFPEMHSVQSLHQMDLVSAYNVLNGTTGWVRILIKPALVRARALIERQFLLDCHQTFAWHDLISNQQRM